jgi:hypothetical protein
VAFDTAANIINDVLLELGLASAPEAEPFTSTDPNVVAMCALLKALGRELVRRRHWTQLQKTHTFSTVGGVDGYDLPDDYAAMAPQTHWNRSTSQPLGGPAGPREWQVLKSSTGASSITYTFRVKENYLYLHPVPSGTTTVAYEYRSAWWVETASDEAGPSTDTPSAGTDTLWFDGHLLSRGLKWKWRLAKRMEATAELNEYMEALAQAEGLDGASPDIDLAAGARIRPRGNVPETGWGS